MEHEKAEKFEVGDFLDLGKEIVREERGKRKLYIQEREVVGMAAQREQRKGALIAGKRKREALKAILNEEW